ncbi:MAG: DNA polymerase domain-containing protein [Verrucomicrobia bacterium]|nr:MAG: DNA polymerase domain-containing protein [Verrucomicrobiota bacterium]
MKKIEETVEIDGRKLTLSNLEKVMWKKEGITKSDIIQYYLSVAPRMIPLVRNRPLMLNRYPHGVPGKSFVQKDWPHHPDWVRTAPVRSESLNKTARHVVCDDKATLVWLANMACIEINQFLASSPNVESHDMVLVDLDPHAPAGFEDSLEIAEAVHAALDQMKLRHMIKTSGADGIHFLIPIVPRYSIEVIRRFVLYLGVLLERLAPKMVSTARNKAQRAGKVYVDYFQNGLQKTIAAPFSLRPEPGAPVSFPLSPRDLKRSIQAKDFNLRTAPALLKKVVEFDTSPDQELEHAFAELGAKS